MKKQITLLICLTLLISCGGGMFTTIKGETVDESYSTPWGNVTITKDAFIFGSDYPSDIVIPDIDGMRDTAFVVSYSSPSGVLAIDLTKNPLAISSSYKGLTSPSGTGMPSSLLILSPERAFLLTSSHVIDFNPRSGAVNAAVNLLKELALAKPLPISSGYDIDGDGVTEEKTGTINMNFPGGLGATQDKLYITMSNFINPVMPAVAAPGTVRVFEIKKSVPYLTEVTQPIITTDFNPTGVTVLKDNSIAITNSGVSDLWDGVSHPISNSSIDIIDPTSDKIVNNISLGSVALSFQEMAVTTDVTTAFIGSASFGEVYGIDLVNHVPLFTHAKPITITGNGEGSDYLPSVALTYDNWYLFVASFDNSSIYPVDVSRNPPKVLPDAFSEPFVLGFPKGVTAENPTGTNTGVGAIAVRPGIPGVDYTGPDLFALTGSPGTLVTINTHGTSKGNQLQIKKMEITTTKSNVNESGDAIQLYLRLEFADGTTIGDITDTFTNPYSGYPVRVTWSSSNNSVATIDGKALLTPKALGETTITARIGQTMAEMRMLIQPSPASSPNRDDTSTEVPADDEEGQGPPEEPQAPPDEDTPESYIPNVIIRINYDLMSWRPRIIDVLIDMLERLRNGVEDEEEIEVLRNAPEGTNPFADAVTEFNPGQGAGFGQDAMPGIVLGAPHGAGDGAGSTDVLSLGRNGEIILEMTDFIIADGDGPDFIVFENAFVGWFEPGTVSVGDDCVTFYEFPCESGTPPRYPGCAGTASVYSNPENGIDPTDPNVAGGNAFDLSDVGLRTARFVKIVDSSILPGGNGAMGFDLDAIAVINGTLP